MDPFSLELLRSFIIAHPDFAMILAAVGLLRVINKPLFAFLRKYVASTPTQEDDKLLAKVEASKTYKTFLFLLDWVASVKPIKKEVEK